MMLYSLFLLLIIPITLTILILYVSFKLPRFDYVKDFKYQSINDYKDIKLKEYI